jgi:hypothetical protein
MSRRRRVGWLVLRLDTPQRCDSNGMLWDAASIYPAADGREITFDATLYPDKRAAVRAVARDMDARVQDNLRERSVGQYALMPVAAPPSPSRAETSDE